MKLPFFNRHRYVEIRAYCDIKWYEEEIPLVLTKDIKSTHLNSKKLSTEEKRYDRTFNSCQGRVAGLRNSITVRNHCEYDIIANKEKWQAVVPTGNKVFNIEPQNDAIYRPKNINVARVTCPWLVESSKPEVNYVLASHILNTTGLSIISGVLFGKVASLNYFLGIPKQDITYVVPFKHPVLQLFPLTELPVHVVSEYNPQKYHELATFGVSRPQFNGAFAFMK